MFLKTMKGTARSIFGTVKHGVGKVLKIGVIVVGSQYAIAGLAAGANALAKNKDFGNKDIGVTAWLNSFLHGDAKAMKTRALNDFAKDVDGAAHGGYGVSHAGNDDAKADVKTDAADEKDNVAVDEIKSDAKNDTKVDGKDIGDSSFDSDGPSDDSSYGLV